MSRQGNVRLGVIGLVGAMALVAMAASATGVGALGGRPGEGRRIEAERADVRTVGGRDGPGWNIWSAGHVAHVVTFGEAERHRVTVRARGNGAGGVLPVMELRVDGRSVGRVEVRHNPGWRFEEYVFEFDAAPGDHEVTVAFVNDPARPDRDVDLIVDWFEVTPVAGGGRPTPPSTIDVTIEPKPTVPAISSTTLPGSTTTVAPTTVPPATVASTTSPTTTSPTTVASTTTSPTTVAPTTVAPTTTGSPTTPGRPGSAGRSPYVPDGYELAWNDEFDELSLDIGGNGGANWATKWVRWNVLSLAGNGDQCMKGHPKSTGTGGPALGLETHRVESGMLTLFGRPIPQQRRSQFWGYEAACGMISGERSHAQTYGYWETRMRIPNVSTGHHWAIWLLPANGSWPPEVDILEVVGTNRGRNTDERRFHFTGHYNDANGNHKADMSHRNAPGAADGWYTLGLQWTANEVVWYLDGQQVHRMPNFIGTDPNYFLISPEIGGNWPGPTDGSTEWPMTMQVDYVRIYSNR